MPSLALVRRRAALIAVCAVRALSTTSERLKQLGRHASIEIAPRQATRYAELAKARPSAPRTVFVNFVDTEDEHFAAVEAACAVLKEAGLDPVPHVPASRVKNAAVKRLRALRDAGGDRRHHRREQRDLAAEGPREQRREARERRELVERAVERAEP